MSVSIWSNSFSLVVSIAPYSTGFDWIDDLIRAHLHSMRATEFRALKWAIGLVIAGVILEEIEPILEWFHIETERLRIFRHGVIVVPQLRLRPWVKRIARIGWIVLVIGLVAEIRLEPDISEIDTNIEYLSEAHIEAARGEAAKANERAAKLEKEAAGLRIDAETLHQKTWLPKQN